MFTAPQTSLSTTVNASALAPIIQAQAALARGARMFCPSLSLLGHRYLGRVLTLCVDARQATPDALQQLANHLRNSSRVPYVRVLPRGDGAVLFEMPVGQPRDILLDHHQPDHRGKPLTLGPLIHGMGNAIWHMDDIGKRHALIVAEGNERLMLLRMLICQIARRESPSECRIAIIDPISLLPNSLTTLAHAVCEPVGDDLFDQQTLLNWAIRESLSKKMTNRKYARLTVVITEGSYWLQQPTGILDLMRLGVVKNINLIIATDQISSGVLDTTTAQQFGSRFVGQMPSDEASVWATGVRGADCHWQRGHGDTLFTPANQRFQCPTVSEDLVDSLPHAQSLLNIKELALMRGVA